MMKEKTDVRVSLLATKSEKEKWQQQAKKMGIGTSSLIRMAVNQFIAKRGQLQ